MIILVMAISIISISARSAQRQREYDGHVEAAEKYLTDLDYEQAIAEYTLALEIEPNNEEVLNALEQTYLDYAQSLVDAGDYEKAVSVSGEGYAQTGRESLKAEISNLVRFVYDKVRLMDYRVIPEAQAEENVRWMINIMKTYFEESEEPWMFARLYKYIGEDELSEELAAIYFESLSPALEKKEDGFWVIEYPEKDGIKTEITYDQYATEIRRKSIFIEDGSVCEYTFEHDERGREVRQTTSQKNNSLAGAKALRGSIRGSGDTEDYELESRAVFEVVEVDSLGRIKCEVYNQYMKHSDWIYEYEITTTYTYNEKGFTIHVVDSTLGDWNSVDYELTNQYGDYVEIEGSRQSGTYD